MISVFVNTFNNREKAIAAWFLFFLVWAFAKKKIRESILDVLKNIFLTKLSFVFLGTLIYTTLIVFLLEKAKIWNLSLMKETVYWILGTGFILLANVGKATRDISHFKRVLLNVFKLTIVLEFVVGLHSFNLLVEMILVPLLFFIIVLNAYAGIKEEYKLVKKLTDWILATFGIYILMFVLSETVSNFRGLTTIYNLHTFILPPILTISFIPFLYAFALIMAYETLFIRLNILLKKEHRLAIFTQIKILILCHLNLGKLNRFVQWSRRDIAKLTSKKGVIKMIENFEARKKNRVMIYVNSMKDRVKIKRVGELLFVSILVIILVAPIVYVFFYSPSLDFWSNSFGNLLATSLALIAGIPIALWVDRQMKKEEEKDKYKQERLRENKILLLVKEELDFSYNSIFLKGMKGNASTLTLQPLKSDLWDALVAGGDTVHIEDPALLNRITSAYYVLKLVKEIEKQAYIALRTSAISFTNKKGKKMNAAQMLLKDARHFDNLFEDSAKEALKSIDKRIKSLKKRT